MTKKQLLNLIPYGKENAIKREDLRKLCGLDDGAMRSLISKIRKVPRLDHVILNDQDGVGYYRPSFPDDFENVLRFNQQELSRAGSILDSLCSVDVFLSAAITQLNIAEYPPNFQNNNENEGDF